nr:immunoglobulin heavy chain junction region [Macaca mulatta]MOV45994.1 immunoglobulin heavy chain junction region [Macaca mulatta]
CVKDRFSRIYYGSSYHTGNFLDVW